MYFPRSIHTTHPGACVAHCKCIDFVCAADYSGVFSALCVFGFLFSSTPSSPQGPLSSHCLREHTRATGTAMGIKLNVNFLLSEVAGPLTIRVRWSGG